MKKNLTFNAIDVETANADMASICQIGIAHVKDGQIHDQWETLLNPDDQFDDMNIRIHGITPEDVVNSPSMPEVRDELRRRLRNSILVSHMPFDRVAFERAMTKYNLEQLQVTWLDSAMVVKRAWPERYGSRGYGLKNVASNLGIEFKHHDALEDARAAAQIILCVCEDRAIDIESCLTLAKSPISPLAKTATKTVQLKKPIGSQKGSRKSLEIKASSSVGETIVSTGKLSMLRKEAEDLATQAGYIVENSVTQNISVLLVGIQIQSGLKLGYDKSRKHLKVEDMINDGWDIKILSEKDFLELLKVSK